MIDIAIIRRKINGRAIPTDVRQDLADLLAEVERLTTRLQVAEGARDEARENAARWKDAAEGLARELEHITDALDRVARR